MNPTDGTSLEIYVKPKSKQFQIKRENDTITVLCRETPTKGRVNRELIKELSKVFKRRVEILSGFTSKQKKLFIWNINIEEINKVLDRVE